MIFERHVCGRIKTNIYIIGDSETKNVAVIDAGDGIEPLPSIIKEKGYNVKRILLTHGHPDHVEGAALARATLNAPVAISENELSYVDSFTADEIIHDGDEFTLDSLKIKAIATPGHTPGGMCYLVGDILFSGDTLFYGEVGRCDLRGGNFEILKNSIKVKLFTLPENTKVYPGHHKDTTIGFEKANNPYLNGKYNI